MELNSLSPGESDLDKYLEKWFEQYYEPMLAYAYMLVEDEMLAEDIISDVFLNIIKANPKLAHITDVRNYLFISIRNSSYKAIALRKRRNNSLEDLPFQPPIDTEEEKIFHESLYASEWVEAVLDTLPPAQKEVLRLSIVEYMSVKEIAKLLNKSEKTVEVQKSKALKNLRDNKNDLPKKLPLYILAIMYLHDQNLF